MMLWRFVNPGEVLRIGDQFWNGREWQDVPVKTVSREPNGPVRRRMRDAEARREYDEALPGLLREMGISSAAESIRDGGAGPGGAKDIESLRTGKISPYRDGDRQRPGVLPGAAAGGSLKKRRKA